ncbi:MAG: hypothetical protein RBR77_10430 [Thauera sp.]|jgi:ATP-dependent DNA helicase RecG|nr:hypothetical protein [Thauera sp.]
MRKSGCCSSRRLAGEVTGEVGRLPHAVVGEISRQQIQSALGLKGEKHFRTAYLKPALEMRVVEMTLPDKPTSRNQRYRLTAGGQHWLAAHPGGAAVYNLSDRY